MYLYLAHDRGNLVHTAVTCNWIFRLIWHENDVVS